MQRLRLGRLGHESSVMIYGGAALSEASREAADDSISLALEARVNHFDTPRTRGTPSCISGTGCRRSGTASSSPPRPASARGGTASQIRRSLERLDVNRVDLIQPHAVGDMAEPDRVTGSGGALEAAIEAREEGLVGAIGITGHGHGAPAVHLEALRCYPFDTVLTSWNYALSRDGSYRRDYEALVEEVRRQDAGLMTIKTLSRRNWPGDEQ